MAVVDDNRNIELIAGHIEEIIKLLGEDCTREGLLKTPIRSAKALYYLTSGYRANIDAVVHQALFEHEGSQIVMVKNIEFYSMCEHHILPFFGTVTVAYVPDGEMIGLSKLPRLVNAIARKLQVQERLTAEICREIKETLSVKGVMCQCRAQHLCMQMRGVEKQLSTTVTTDYNGIFETDPILRQEFYAMLSQQAR